MFRRLGKGLGAAGLVGALLALVAVGRLVAGGQPNATPVDRTHDTLRRQTERTFDTAARLVGGSIRPGELVIGSREGVLLALAPLHGVAGLHALTYLSFPTYACASTLPPGYYTVQFQTLPTTGEQQAVFRNLAGQRITALRATASPRPPWAPSAVVATSSRLGQDTPCMEIEGVGTTYLDLINLQ